MTDRVNGLMVTLDRDMRTDDVEHVVSAIRMMRFVTDVSYEECITNLDTHRVRRAYVRIREVAVGWKR